MSRTPISASLAALVALPAAVLVFVGPAGAVSGLVGVGFNAPEISGFRPGGSVFLTGGGAYDPAAASDRVPESAFVHSNGGFRCLEAVEQGPLEGCLKDEGIRWDTDGLLESTLFTCTNDPLEQKKTAVTDKDTAVLLSDFYRAGNGNDADFKKVKVIVSDGRDLDGDPNDGVVRNVWIQGVGCGAANVNFSSAVG